MKRIGQIIFGVGGGLAIFAMHLSERIVSKAITLPVRKRPMKKILKVGAALAFVAAAVGAVAVFGPAAAVSIAGSPGGPVQWFFLGGTFIASSAIALSATRRKLKVKPLTKGEIAAAQSIFGNEIPESTLAGIRKQYQPRKKKDAVASACASERRISFNGQKHHEKDYSRAKDAFNYGTYFHEMTHIQQGQPSAKFREYVPGEHYDYQLYSNSRFDDFYTEQQASIIDDYARRFLFPYADISAQRMKIGDDELLMKVVEDRFPEARKSRLHLEPRKKAQAAKRLNPLIAARYGDLDGCLLARTTQDWSD